MATQVTRAGFKKDPPSVMGVGSSDIVVDSIVESMGAVECGFGEANDATNGSDVQPKLLGNTFECLA